jgi:pilus assembly protein CpaF
MKTIDIFRETTRHFLRPVLPLLDDPSVSEILINGAETIYFERAGRLHRAEGVRFTDDSAVLAAARNIGEFVGRRVDADTHSMDARLPDGSRVHVIVPPSSRNGVCISIRKFQKSSLPSSCGWRSCCIRTSSSPAAPAPARRRC